MTSSPSMPIWELIIGTQTSLIKPLLTINITKIANMKSSISITISFKIVIRSINWSRLCVVWIREEISMRRVREFVVAGTRMMMRSFYVCNPWVLTWRDTQKAITTTIIYNLPQFRQADSQKLMRMNRNYHTLSICKKTETKKQVCPFKQ